MVLPELTDLTPQTNAIGAAWLLPKAPKAADSSDPTVRGSLVDTFLLYYNL